MTAPSAIQSAQWFLRRIEHKVARISAEIGIGFSAASIAKMREPLPKTALYCAEPDCRESASLATSLNQADFLRDVVPRSGFKAL